MSCPIDWPAFGLADPEGYTRDTGCTQEPVILLTQACVHEHVACGEVCGPCYSEIISYEPDPGEWACGPCAALGHQCAAPLVITELDVSPS